MLCPLMFPHALLCCHSAPTQEQTIVMRKSVCGSVGMRGIDSVWYEEPHIQTSPNFLHMLLCMAMA